MRSLLLVFSLLFLFALEILRVYFIMPFPGSQQSETISIAYFLDKNIFWLRLLGFVLLLISAYSLFKYAKRWKKWLFTFFLLLYGFIFYMFNFKFLAEKMFYQPKVKTMLTQQESKVDTNALVLATVIHGDARAYPVQVIGYHHQVLDTIGGEPVMVTYCTVCRTGRIFSPFVDGKYEHFRLVGMDHFNAMFEDRTTRSWWRQVTGEAITGDMKGKNLLEIYSIQTRLGSWLAAHPDSKIMQPDSNYKKRYENLSGYDSGTIAGSLEKRDSSSWQFKSWVIGVISGKNSKAYDWNDLVKDKLIEDTIAGAPVVLWIEKDSVSFHAFRNDAGGSMHHFEIGSSGLITDKETHSEWSYHGEAVNGPLKGNTLPVLPAYQEFWHSWKYFHPATTAYKGK